MLMLTLDPPRPFTKPNPRSPQRLNGRSLSPHHSYRTPRPTSPSLGHPLSILSLLFIYLLFIYIYIIDSFIDFFFSFLLSFMFYSLHFPPLSLYFFSVLSSLTHLASTNVVRGLVQHPPLVLTSGLFRRGQLHN